MATKKTKKSATPTAKTKTAAAATTAAAAKTKPAAKTKTATPKKTAERVSVATLKADLDELKAMLAQHIPTNAPTVSPPPTETAAAQAEPATVNVEALAEAWWHRVAPMVERRVEVLMREWAAAIVAPMRERLDEIGREIGQAVESNEAKTQAAVAQMAATLVALVKEIGGNAEPMLHLIESASGSSTNIILPEEIRALFGDDETGGETGDETGVPAPGLRALQRTAQDDDGVLQIIDATTADLTPTAVARPAPSTLGHPHHRRDEDDREDSGDNGDDDERDSAIDLDADDIAPAHGHVSQLALRPIARMESSDSDDERRMLAAAAELTGNQTQLLRRIKARHKSGEPIDAESVWDDVTVMYPACIGGRDKFDADWRHLLATELLPKPAEIDHRSRR